MTTSLPLAGVRVFDLTTVVMGPYATQQLADLGADVITIEVPRVSANRVMGAGPKSGLSGIALNLLRNKRSVILDLKHQEGQKVAARLAERCDVFVTNLRPGSLRRLGLDYEALAAVNPGIVYCQAQGFPLDSDKAEEPAYDDIIQAATGVADLSAQVLGRPTVVPTILADKVSGLFIAQAVLAGLYRRSATGEGAYAEVPMVDAMTSFMLVEHAAAATSVPPVGAPGYNRILTPNRRPGRSKDGWVHVLPYSRQNYVDIFTAGGRTDLVEDPRIQTLADRLANADCLYGLVEELLPAKTTEEWLTFCSEHGIPCTAIATVAELVAEQPVIEHPVVGAYRAIRPPFRLSGLPDDVVRLPAPVQGAHTVEVLGEIGYSANEIEKLTENGAVGTEVKRRVH